MQQWQVRDVMTRQVATATPDTPVGDLARLLAAHRVSAVPIVDGDRRVIGIVSEADLLPKIAGGRRAKDHRAARDVMSNRPLTVTADAPLSVAAAKMQNSKVKRLIVLGEGGELLGVVSRSDALRPLTRPDAVIRENVIDHVLRRTLWIDFDQVGVDVHGGVVTLTGTVGRRTTADLAARLTRRTPGVVAVVDRLRYEFDDTALARSRPGPFSAEPFHPRRPAA